MGVGYQKDAEDQPAARQGAESPEWASLKGDVGDIADAAVQRGRHFLDAAKEQATVYVDRRKDNVAQSVTDLAGSLRESTSSFEDRPNIRAFVDSAAEGLDQLADSIRERSFADIFNEVEDVVRRRPAAVAAVTIAVGFLAARFIKSSAEGLRQEYAAQDSSSRSSPRGSNEGPKARDRA